MKKSQLACALLALAALAGCGKLPTTPNAALTEQAAVTTTLAANPAFTADDLFDASSSVPAFGARPAGGAGPAAAINPRWFWRTITHADRSFQIAFSDSDSTGHPRQADVVVLRHLTGTFNILKAMPGDSTHLDSANVVHKALDDTWERHLRARRVLAPGTDHVEWRVTGVSAVKVTSAGATTNIASVRVKSGSRDTTITDPLALWTLPQVHAFAPGDSVRLTVTTSRTDDVVLAYWHDHRERFHNNGDGTYSFTLHIGGSDGGPRFFGVNAFSHGTLFDDVAAYDSMAWIFHCFVGTRPSGDLY